MLFPNWTRSARRGIVWTLVLTASLMAAPAAWAADDEPEVVDEIQAAPAPPPVTKRVFQHEMAVTAIDITRNGNVAVTGSADGAIDIAVIGGTLTIARVQAEGARKAAAAELVNVGDVLERDA